MQAESITTQNIYDTGYNSHNRNSAKSKFSNQSFTKNNSNHYQTKQEKDRNLILGSIFIGGLLLAGSYWKFSKLNGINQKFKIFKDMGSKTYTPEEIKNLDNRNKNRDHVTSEMRNYILERDDYTCAICGKSKKKHRNIQFHIDHILAWIHGGKTESSNLQTLCSKCNNGKSDYFGLDPHFNKNDI